MISLSGVKILRPGKAPAYPLKPEMNSDLLLDQLMQKRKITHQNYRTEHKKTLWGGKNDN